MSDNVSDNARSSGLNLKALLAELTGGCVAGLLLARGGGLAGAWLGRSGAPLEGLDGEVAQTIRQARAEVLADPRSGAAWGLLGRVLLANEMYQQSFVEFNYGRGSALAVILFVAVLPLVAYNIVQLRKERAIR